MGSLGWITAGREWLAKDDTVQATANFFGLLAGVLLVIAAIRYAVRFVTEAYRTSIRTSIRRAWYRRHRRAVEASRDPVVLGVECAKRLLSILAWIAIASSIPIVGFGLNLIAVLEAYISIDFVNRVDKIHRSRKRKRLT